MDKNAFFKYQEDRAKSGYKSALLVKLPYETSGKYSLFLASETAPYVFGEKETFEFDLLQSETKGQVAGKISLEPKEIEVLHHRDNQYRADKIKGVVVDCMTINSEFVGYKFRATIDYRPNDAEADVNRATLTITPMSAETTPVYNARPYIIETLAFANGIPETVKVNEKFDLSVKQNVTATVTAKKIDGANNTETDATSSVVSTNIQEVSISATGLYALTVSAEGYASWTTTVYVEAVASN